MDTHGDACSRSVHRLSQLPTAAPAAIHPCRVGDPLLFTEARDLGVSRRQLRGSRWQSPTYSVYVRAAGCLGLAERCRAVARVLPSGTPFSHWTAARLHGLWLPSAPDWLPLMARLPPGLDRPERSGLYVARSRAGYVATRTLQDVTAVTPEVCLAQLAEDLRLIDLVVAIDSALHLKLCTVDSILDAVRAR